MSEVVREDIPVSLVISATVRGRSAAWVVVDQRNPEDPNTWLEVGAYPSRDLAERAVKVHEKVRHIRSAPPR